MSTPHDVAVLVGSLRKASVNLKLAHALEAMASPSLKLDRVEIGDLPLYNDDLEVDPPPAWTRFRQRIAGAEALLFVTPEYNRSVPGVLKNALDVGSRPYGENAWAGKPAAVISGSPGAIGGFGANHHLRQSLVFLDVRPLQQPEAYVGGAHKLFDPQGNLTTDETRKFLQGFMDAFAAWVEKQLGG